MFAAPRGSGPIGEVRLPAGKGRQAGAMRYWKEDEAARLGRVEGSSVRLVERVDL